MRTRQRRQPFGIEFEKSIDQGISMLESVTGMRPALLEKSPGHLINHTAASLRLMVLRQFKARGYDVTPEQGLVLDAIWQNEGISQRAIADITRKDKPTVTRILDLLEKKELISRQHDERDRRSYRIFLTPEGKMKMETFISIVRATDATAFKGISGDEMQTLKSILSKIVKNTTLVLAAALLLVSGAAAQETLTWEECVAAATRNNPDLRSSGEKIKQSKDDVPLAASGYLPQVSANAGVSANGGDVQINGVTVTNQRNNYSASLNGKLTVFDGLKTVYGIKSAKSMVESAKYDFAVVSARVRLDLRNAFIQLLKAQESIVISRDIVDRRAKNYDLVQMRYRAGREHRGALLNAEASLAQAKLNLLEAERDIVVSRRALLGIMGSEPYRPIAVTGILASDRGDRKAPEYGSIAPTHPLVQSIRLQGKAAQNDINSNIASFSPVVSATGSIGRSGEAWPPGSTTWSVGVDVTVPLVQSVSTYFNYDKAKSRYRQILADEMSTRLQVETDLAQKWTAWQNAIDEVEVQRKFVEAAVERAKIAEAQYAIGLLLFDNWIIIEDDLARNKRSYLEAQANEMAAEAAWLQAKGETLHHE